MVVDQPRDYLEHGSLSNAVNFPQEHGARVGLPVAIANANVPNMLGQISTAMAHAGLNIHNMITKRAATCLHLVDVDSPVLPQVQAIGRDRRRAGGSSYLPAH
jgi:D-3-phosphoglycerate dehydrogenase